MSTAQSPSDFDGSEGSSPLLDLDFRSRDASTAEGGAALSRLIARDFLCTSLGGEWQSRAQYLEKAAALRPRRKASVEDRRLRVLGALALSQGVFEIEADGLSPLVVRHTDVFHRQQGLWQLVSVQETALRDGVSRLQRPYGGVAGPSISSPPWRGGDVGEGDPEVLRNLNENYVRAFRECDLPWYEAHLSADYTVVNGDGSFDGRARALSEFARPVFSEHLQSFPVDRVRIRIFGAVALIHAENAYRLKDGRQGINRYTDIWHKGEGGPWSCISAHITAKKSPG